MPPDIKVAEENFKNDDILTKDEFTLEIIRLIKKNYEKRKKNFPFKLNLQIPDDFNFLHWEFIYTVAQKADLLKLETKVMQKFTL